MTPPTEKALSVLMAVLLGLLFAMLAVHWFFRCLERVMC
jgi:hypothetical protein